MEPKRITIRDIAEAAGVSTSLVSFVMNGKGKRYRVSEEMTRRILAMARELNYRPNNAARSLRSGRSHTIGVVVSDISNSFFAEICRCIEDDASRHGYTVIFGSSDERADKFRNLVEVLLSKGVDGLILVPCEGVERRIEEIHARGVPLVLLDRTVGTADVGRVLLDNRKAAALAVEHLAGNGCRRIELVSYSMRLSNLCEREQGYAAAMEKLGLGNAVRIHRIDFHDVRRRSDMLMQQLFLRPDRGVEALVFATNSLAASALKALGRYGISVPCDVAVVAFDGNEVFDLYRVSVTSIRQPIRRIGREAVQSLLRSIEQDSAAVGSTVVLDPELVAGESSRRL